jgi:hypothetical protein
MSDITVRRYHWRKRWAIYLVYLLAFAIWLGIAWWLRLFVSGVVGFLIGLTPLVLFTISTISIPYLTSNVEDEMFRANFLSLGLVVVIPLFGLMSANYKGDQRQFLLLLLLAIVFAMLSLVDIWLSPNYMSVAKHVKSVLQIYAIFMLVYAIWLYGSRCAKPSFDAKFYGI